MKCSYCGEEIEDGLEVCPFCNGEVNPEVQEPTTKEDAKDPQETAPKESPADKSKAQEKARVTPVKSQGKGALVGVGILGAIALVGFVVMSVLFIKTNLELAEAKDSIGRLEYQLAAAQSASSSGNGQVDTSALPPAPASYKGTADGMSWEAYKYKDKSCAIIIDPQDEGVTYLDLNIKYKDASGGLMGAKSEHLMGLAKNHKVAVHHTDIGEFYDIEIAVSEKSNDGSKYCDLTETHTINGKKVLIEFTNIDEAKPSSAPTQVLFYKEGKLVYCNNAYPSSLEPGASEAKEVSAYEDFDRADVYINAYRW